MKLIKNIKFIIIKYIFIYRLNNLKRKLEANKKDNLFIGICYLISMGYYNPIYSNFHKLYKQFLLDNSYDYNYTPSLFGHTFKVRPANYWFPTHPYREANQVRIDYINYLIININTLLPITLTNLNNLKNK